MPRAIGCSKEGGHAPPIQHLVGGEAIMAPSMPLHVVHGFVVVQLAASSCGVVVGAIDTVGAGSPGWLPSVRGPIEQATPSNRASLLAR